MRPSPALKALALGVPRRPLLHEQLHDAKSRHDETVKNPVQANIRSCAPGGTRTPNPFLRTELLFH